jgi:hypothetical protein
VLTAITIEGCLALRAKHGQERNRESQTSSLMSRPCEFGVLGRNWDVRVEADSAARVEHGEWDLANGAYKAQNSACHEGWLCHAATPPPARRRHMTMIIQGGVVRSVSNREVCSLLEMSREALPEG